MEITRELIDQQRRPRFGQANPERMAMAFWEWMVREEHGPWDVRRQWDVPSDREQGPIWCFQRMGATRTEMPDGRTICVGGEHEDWYDEDFCIYNDVIVLCPNGEVEIYGYPREMFPPTDFHTATLVDNRIILIGRLGYPPDRVPGFTPVYGLDTNTYRIEKIETYGEPPGWLFKHSAELNSEGKTVTVTGGERIEREEDPFNRQNVEEYQLDLDSGRWRSTNRGWRQFLIGCQESQSWSDRDEWLGDEVFHIQQVPFEVLPELDSRTRQITVNGVCISLAEQSSEVRIIVRGSLRDEIVKQVVQDVLGNIEQAINQPCYVLEL